MNTNKTIVCAFLAVLFALTFTGCDNDSTSNSARPITYAVIQAGGVNGLTTTTGIVFTFSASVDSLTAADITVSGGAAEKGSATLSGSGTVWTLAPITVNGAGPATVKITKDGIETATKSVTVYKAGQMAPEYWTITWNLNGGTEGTVAYPKQILKNTVLARPPDPTKAGNTFSGWYTNSALTQTYTFTNPVTANLNLYAKWETAGPLSALTGEWYRKTDNNILAFEITSAGKFIMAGTTYDIAVSGNTATITFGGTSVGTFGYAISNDEMILINGTGIGITVVALSPVVKLNNPGGVDPSLPGRVTGVELDRSNLMLVVGETGILYYQLIPANATNKAVTWSSSNTTSVALVSAPGYLGVTAVGVGTAIITVTTLDGGYRASCIVTVVASAALF